MKLMEAFEIRLTTSHLFKHFRASFRSMPDADNNVKATLLAANCLILIFNQT